MDNEQEEVIVDSTENNEEADAQTEVPDKVEKPKRTPEQELEYFEGRAKRLRKDLGLETEPKVQPKEDKVDSSITAKDVLILTGAGYTHEEDIEVIEKWAKFNGTSIRDALNDSTLKTVLGTKQEERKTAQATATGGGARGVKSPSIDAILADASRGKLPENDSDISKLAEARMAKRLEGK